MKYRSIALALCICSMGIGTVASAQEVIMRRPLPTVAGNQGGAPVDPADPSDPGNPTDPSDPSGGAVSADTFFIATATCSGITMAVNCNRVEREVVMIPAGPILVPSNFYEVTGTGTVSQCASQGQPAEGAYILDQARDEISLNGDEFFIDPNQVATVNGAPCGNYAPVEINANVMYCEEPESYCYREGVISRGGSITFNDNITEELDPSECVQSAEYSQQVGYSEILSYTGGVAASPEGLGACAAILNPPKEGFYVDSGYCTTEITEETDGSTTIEDKYEWYCEEVLNFDEASGNYDTRRVSSSICENASQSAAEREIIANFFTDQGYNDPQDVDPNECIGDIGGGVGDFEIEVKDDPLSVESAEIRIQRGGTEALLPNCNYNDLSTLTTACPVYFSIIEEITSYSFFCHAYGFSDGVSIYEGESYTPSEQNGWFGDPVFVRAYQSGECSAQLDAVIQQRTPEIDGECSNFSGLFGPFIDEDPNPASNPAPGDDQFLDNCENRVTLKEGTRPNEGILEVRRRYLGQFNPAVHDFNTCYDPTFDINGNGPTVIRGHVTRSCDLSGGIE